MDSRTLAALLSSLTPHLISILLISLNPNPNPNPISLLLSHFLSVSHAATAVLSRKRKPTHLHSPPNKLPRLGSQSDTIKLPYPSGVDSFKLTFKMTSASFEWLAGLLEPLLDCRDPPGLSLDLPAETRLGIGLFRLATGADFLEISSRFGVSELVSRFCVKQLCRVLCTNFRFWVSFPNPVEVQSFSNLPNCCGVITTTTFELLKIGKDSKNSIKMQVVVDSSCRILSIFAGLCGNKSGFAILKRSSLYTDVEEGRVLNGPLIYIDDIAVPQFLIGEGDYPLLPWLITPFLDPTEGSCEDDFNLVVNSIRGSSIRVISSLRSWGVLSKPIEGETRDAVAYIGACSILHNGLLMREDHSALSDDVECFEGFKGGSLRKSLIENEGSAIRRALATRVKGDL